MVVCRAGSHVRSSLHHQLHGVRVHALDGGCNVAGNGITLLWHLHDVVWTSRRDRWPDRSDATARALVARMACHSARAVCPLNRPRRVPGAALRIERVFHQTPVSSGGASRTADASAFLFVKIYIYI